ncbi:hypothetical protein [Streptomyces sp. RFCAC02]|uniref:hypothetical protein n=1 Tax=Streptomyces sp. RFCAC02 TaxID=2499143 RepID=UPI0010219F96|nr:hypothetical protein [Streptomyces sp. RFCAC02]
MADPRRHGHRRSADRHRDRGERQRHGEPAHRVREAPGSRDDDPDDRAGADIPRTGDDRGEARFPAPETTASEPTPTKDPGPASTFAGDGEYLVGEDIAPGTYKTAGPDDDFGCYWARLKNASGEFDAIIANNNLNGPGRVTLKKGEYFQTQRCQEWVKSG